MRRRRRWGPPAAIAAVFLALAALLMPNAITGQATYLASDMGERFAPYRDDIGRPPAVHSPVQTDQIEHTTAIVAFYRSLKDGEFQTWDPRSGMGSPLGTLPYPGILSPLNLPHLVVPSWFAITLRAFLSLVVGQWFTYLLLRRLDVHRSVAVVGAVAYAFTGTNLVFVQRIGAVWVLPGLVWALHRAAERVTVGRGLLCGAFVAWCWFEGFPSAFIYALYVGVLWAVWLGFRQLRRGHPLPEVFRRVLGLGGGIGWGIGLALVTLLPFVLEVGDRELLSRRDIGADHHLPGIHLFGLLDLGVNGDPLLPATWWTGWNPYESVVLVGSLVLAASGLGMVAAVSGRLRLTSTQRDAWPFFVVLAGAVAFLDFIGGPLLGLVYEVPGIANNPFLRSRFLIALGLVVVASISLDRFLHRDRGGVEVSEAAPRIVSGLVVGGFLVASALQVDDLHRLAGPWSRRDDLAVGAAIAVGAALVALIAAIVVRRLGRGVVLLSAGLTVALFVQLAWPLRNFTPESPVEVTYTRTAGHTALERLTDGQYRFAATDSNFYPNSAQLFDLFDLRGLTLYGLEIRALVETATPNAFARDPLKQIIFRDEWNLASPVYDDLALRYFALGTDEEPFGSRVVLDEPSGWSELGGPRSFAVTAPGRLAGIALPLRSEGCDRSRVVLTARSDGRLLDTTSRPAYDAVGDWLPFGLVGGRVQAGDRVELDLAVEPASRSCSVSVGDSGSSPAVAVYLDDPQDAVELVETEQAWIYERPTARPMVSAHTDWRWFDTAEALHAALATRPEADADVAYLVGSGPDPDGTGTATITSSRIGNDEVALDVAASRAAVVILSQDAARGWRASVDGEPSDLLDVDGALMGVQVPAGRHSVRFTYVPRAFHLGALVSGATLVGGAALALMAWNARRRQALRQPKDTVPPGADPSMA